MISYFYFHFLCSHGNRSDFLCPLSWREGDKQVWHVELHGQEGSADKVAPFYPWPDPTYKSASKLS